MRRAGGEVVFVTKGDANDEPERWSVAADGAIGRATRARARRSASSCTGPGSREGKLALIAIPAALLVLARARVASLPRVLDPVARGGRP